MPTLLANGGPVIWLILIAAATAAVVFVERALFCHRSQINSAEFLNGVRTVLKRDNVVEAISICDATPGPVARLVKAAILNRDTGPRPRARSRRGSRPDRSAAAGGKIESAGDHRADCAAARLVRHDRRFHSCVQAVCRTSGLYAHIGGETVRSRRASGKRSSARRRASRVAIPAHAGYNYLVSRVNKIVLDMERAAAEIVNIVTENGTRQTANEISAQRQNPAQPFRRGAVRRRFFSAGDFSAARRADADGGHSAATARCRPICPAWTSQPWRMAVEQQERLYFENQIVTEPVLKTSLIAATKGARAPLTLVIHADKAVSYENHRAFVPAGARTAASPTPCSPRCPRAEDPPTKP